MGIAGQARVHDPDDHVLPLLTLSEIHRAHVALAQAFDKAVPPESLRIFAAQRFTHSGSP